MEKKNGIKVYGTELAYENCEELYVSGILAGVASPAADYLAERIDINKLIIKKKEYTFIGKVEGTSMVDTLLNDGGLIIIDRSLVPRDNDKVLACIDGEFTMNTDFHI